MNSELKYCNKDSVNILTALLVAHGVRYAVVCPGSRNAPISHNLVVCPDVECHSVTDERSAGFYALGMAQAVGGPVAVCVTSGTALLNLMPAVAEAFYQRVPLVVISADRPLEWIDQLDGQTLPQGDALGRFVRKAVTLPEDDRWHCNRLVNEALHATRLHGGGPVHINVPLSEPLYEFAVEALPEERTIFLATSRCDRRLLSECAGQFVQSRRPMIVVGQTSRDDLLAEDFRGIGQCAVVLNEALSIGCGGCHFDEVLAQGDVDDRLLPDFVLVMGGVLVSKHLKHFLRQLPADVPVWAVSEDGQVRDTFQHLCGVIEGHPADVLDDLNTLAGHKQLASSEAFVSRWEQVLSRADEAIDSYDPPYSQMAAVRMLEAAVDELDDAVTYYGNSSAVRLANVYADHYVFCHRGVSGIEGTVSSAAGFSLATDECVFCVVGDLSFFYDANALWNRELRQNLRILLLNNGGGGIFEKFDGLKQSPARERFVMACHHTSAEGLCQSYGVRYRAARNMDELETGIDWLTDDCEDGSPLLLEVFTNSAEDSRAWQEHFSLTP